MTEVAREIRKLWKAVEGVRQRRDETLIEGIVSARQGAKLKVELGKDENGQPIISPWLKVPSNTGKRGGGVSKFTKFGLGEAVLVVSPSGRLGPKSAVMAWVDTSKDPSPGTAENDGEFMEIGSARIEQRDGLVRITVGGVVLAITPDGLAVTGGSITHNGKRIDDTHTHGGILPGGASTSVPD